MAVFLPTFSLIEREKVMHVVEIGCLGWVLCREYLYFRKMLEICQFLPVLFRADFFPEVTLERGMSQLGEEYLEACGEVVGCCLPFVGCFGKWRNCSLRDFVDAGYSRGEVLVGEMGFLPPD